MCGHTRGKVSEVSIYDALYTHKTSSWYYQQNHAVFAHGNKHTSFNQLMICMASTPTVIIICVATTIGLALVHIPPIHNKKVILDLMGC